MALLVTAAIVVWLAPQEKTLGQGIRSVYVHVALTWVGMIGLTLGGLLGLVTMFWANARVSTWMQVIGWVGLAFYAAGLITSALASIANWGNVFWQEPRMRAALNVFAVALVVEVLVSWVPWLRVRGLLSFGLAILLGWSTFTAPLVLHPRNAVRASSSIPIQLTFLSLTLLCGAAAAWIAWHLKRRMETVSS